MFFLLFQLSDFLSFHFLKRLKAAKIFPLFFDTLADTASYSCVGVVSVFDKLVVKVVKRRLEFDTFLEVNGAGLRERIIVSE